MSNDLWELVRYFVKHQREHDYPNIYLLHYDPTDQNNPYKDDPSLLLLSDTPSRIEVNHHNFSWVVRPWGWTMYHKDDVYSRGIIDGGTVIYKKA